jgi:hypothetical protein
MRCVAADHALGAGAFMDMITIHNKVSPSPPELCSQKGAGSSGLGQVRENQAPGVQEARFSKRRLA